MEAKRSNFQSVHKLHSSKTQIPKTASEVSLTPSQVAEQAKINERKNPLDALSRLSLRDQGVEKRSGLQDVDAEYLKKNLFSRSNLSKHSGLNDSYEHHGHAVSLAQDDASHAQMEQLHAKPLSTSYISPDQPTSQSTHPHQPPEIVPQQPIHQSHTSSPMQCKNQLYKEPHLSQMPSSVEPRNQQRLPTQSRLTPVAEPELCTTCPNCQTTIYLTREHEASGEAAQVYNSNHPDITSSTPVN
ncbi:uncharacterized protein LOC128859819 isoform X1 [Anastrepha ludens]|uniref:uncharacterized protein LOC128859819 isoform X1 n=1 Tax=Anastrepha ludens TaxID=28586 RepID=UPI0023B01616|nr:uncharacterized protein LOC128859819 isoform X1 [Anastrepha ludens]